MVQPLLLDALRRARALASLALNPADQLALEADSLCILWAESGPRTRHYTLRPENVELTH